MTHLHRRLTVDKFIGFNIDYKNTLACLAQAGRPDIDIELVSQLDQP